MGVHSQCQAADLAGNLESIREAARQADWVLFSLHAHQPRGGATHEPADFIEEFARAAIDAGAHAIIGHGPHELRGIEIMAGRPIFYSLGNFFYQNQTVQKLPADFYERYQLDPYGGTPADAFDTRLEAPPQPGRIERTHVMQDEKYWISVLPRMGFKGDRLSKLELYPVHLNRSLPRTQRGRPMLAQGTQAKRILRNVAELSAPYGTQISIRDGIGRVKLSRGKG